MNRIIVSLLLFQASLFAADPKNLFFNGNFAEPLVNGQIPGWTTGGTIVMDGNDKALRLDRPKSAMAQQVVAVPAGTKKVKFSIKVRQGSVQGARYEILLHALDADKQSLQPNGELGSLANLNQVLGTAIDKPTKGWKTIRLGNRVPPNAAFISVMLFALDSGEVDFKDVVCEIETR